MFCLRVQGLANLLVIRYLPSDLFKKRQNNDDLNKFPRHEYRGKSSETGLNTVGKNEITSFLWFLLGIRMNVIKMSQFYFWHTEIVCCWFPISRYLRFPEKTRMGATSYTLGYFLSWFCPAREFIFFVWPTHAQLRTSRARNFGKLTPL